MTDERSPNAETAPYGPSLAGRVDEACDDFERAWKAGRRPRIEEYLARAIAPERPALLRELLAQDRLVTVVGPGGIGKTAIALAIADRMRAGLRDGVCFVDLAPLADARLVSTALAAALGVGVVS